MPLPPQRGRTVTAQRPPHPPPPLPAPVQSQKPIEVYLGEYMSPEGPYQAHAMILPAKIGKLVRDAIKSKHRRAEVAGGAVVVRVRRAKPAPSTKGPRP